MPGVRIKDGDPIERAMRIFKKQVEKSGVISEVRKREFYEKPSVKRKRKMLAAQKRRIKQMRKLGLL